VFFSPSIGIRALALLITLNSVTVQDLRKTCLLNHLFLVITLKCNSDKKADSGKVPKFNGDPQEFSCWKTNFYSYIMGLDEELRDILEDGVGDLDLDEEGATVDRKKHTPAQKKMYKKHHKIKGYVCFSLCKL